MVSVLTRIFGVHNLALAEDVVQDSFCRALEVWSFRGMPENPSAWLMAQRRTEPLTFCGVNARPLLSRRSWGDFSIVNGRLCR